MSKPLRALSVLLVVAMAALIPSAASAAPPRPPVEYGPLPGGGFSFRLGDFAMQIDRSGKVGISSKQNDTCTLTLIERGRSTSWTVPPSQPCTPSSALAGRDVTAPSAPTGLSVVPSLELTQVSWSAPPEQDVFEYRVYLDGTLIRTVPAPATSAELSGLSDGSHEVSVSAVDRSGNESARSKGEVFSTVPPDTVAPLPPVGVAPVIWGNRYTTTGWGPSPEGDVVKYRFYGRIATEQEAVSVYMGGAPAPALAAADLLAELPAGTLEYTHRSAENDVYWVYSVTAVDAAGNESAPGHTVGVPANTDMPPAPVVTAVPGDGTVFLDILTKPEPFDPSMRLCQTLVYVDGVELGMQEWGARYYTVPGTFEHLTSRDRLTVGGLENGVTYAITTRSHSCINDVMGHLSEPVYVTPSAG